MTIEEIKSVLLKIDYETIWPGFHSYPFALYNQNEVYLEDRIIPWDDRFRGNTCIEFEGRYLAIWNISQEPITADPHRLYPMVHEMFHCFQREHQEQRFPDDLKMLLAPEDPLFYALRAKETALLYDAFTASHDTQQSLFYQFAAMRQRLLETYPDFVKQICYAETIEGSAESAGLKTLAQLSPQAYAQQVNNHLNKLKQPELLFDIRRLTYYTGALTLILAKKLGMSWNQNIQGQMQSNFELIFPHQKPFTGDIEIPEGLIETMQTRQAILKDKIANVEKGAQLIALNQDTIICGYDPMNMQRFGDKVHCSHFVFLMAGDEFLKIDGETVLNMQPESPNKVVSYTKK